MKSRSKMVIWGMVFAILTIAHPDSSALGESHKSVAYVPSGQAQVLVGAGDIAGCWDQVPV